MLTITLEQFWILAAMGAVGCSCGCICSGLIEGFFSSGQ